MINQNMKYRVVLSYFTLFQTACPRTSKLNFESFGAIRLRDELQ